MKFLIIKTLFCPNKEFLDINLKSIIKSNIYIDLNKKSNYNFDLLLIGWSHVYQKKIDNFINFIKAIYDNIFVEQWVINYGKYKVLNYISEFIKKHRDYTYILYMDHDLYFDLFTIKNLDELIKLLEIDINSKKIGLLCFNHKIDIRHQPTIYENILMDSNNIIVWPNDNCSIATGAYLAKADIFSKLDKFELKAVYGLDDYYLCKKLSDMGLINVVIHNSYVVHPKEHNNKYNDWKKNNIIKLIQNNQINYFQNIEESMNIFN